MRQKWSGAFGLSTGRVMYLLPNEEDSRGRSGGQSGLWCRMQPDTWAQAAGQSGARALGPHGLAGGPSLVPQV